MNGAPPSPPLPPSCWPPEMSEGSTPAEHLCDFSRSIEQKPVKVALEQSLHFAEAPRTPDSELTMKFSDLGGKFVIGLNTAFMSEVSESLRLSALFFHYFNCLLYAMFVPMKGTLKCTRSALSTVNSSEIPSPSLNSSSILSLSARIWASASAWTGVPSGDFRISWFRVTSKFGAMGTFRPSIANESGFQLPSMTVGSGREHPASSSARISPAS